ncbi:hypothetical protein F1880_008291 [Penicillium rolfsii]|nr:hypothetical protein F1880_008291 [Penicillium rolfsii]
MTGGHRQRRSMPKVRTGCATCKNRRVKCDETRPSCQRCTRTGRACPGYRLEVRPKIDNEIKIYNLPFKVPGSKADRELLHFYCCETSESLSRFSATTLWTHLVLQQSQHQPVIRHALVALSSLYRDYLQVGSRQLKTSPQHIQLITRSHKQLSTHLVFEEASSETALICSIIFYTFECLIGDTQQAMWHLNQGLRLLSRLWSSIPRDETDPDGINRQLRTAFSRLDIHASIFFMERTPILELVSPEQMSEQAHVVPEWLASLSDAEDALLALQNWTLRHLLVYIEFKGMPHHRIPPQALQERLRLKTEFERLGKAIAELTTRADAFSFTPSQRQSLTLLEAQTHMFHAVVLGHIELSTDSHVSSLFNLTIDQLSEILSRSVKENDPGLHRDFTPSSNIIAILYFICMRTHDQRILHRSLSLMQDHLGSARDGLWDSRMAVTVVKAMQTRISHRNGLEKIDELDLVGGGIVDTVGGLDRAFENLGITEKEC